MRGRAQRARESANRPSLVAQTERDSRGLLAVLGRSLELVSLVEIVVDQAEPIVRVHAYEQLVDRLEFGAQVQKDARSERTVD